MERPGPGPVPERRRGSRDAAGRHSGPRLLRARRRLQAGLGRGVLLGGPRPGRWSARGGRGSGRGGDEPGGRRSDGSVPTTCGRFAPALCAAYTEAATTGRLSPATAELLRRSSPASVTDRITAPTLVVQGEADTLFGLDQADATARQIAAAGGTVRVLWYGGGHDGGAPDQRVRDAIGEWFDHWLAGDGDDPGTSFGYTVASGVRTGGDTPTSRTVEAPAYPGLPGTPAVSTQPLPLDGGPQVALVPPGGSPAAITSLPGLGGALGNLGNRVAAFTAELPGQSAVFRTAPVDAPLLVAGAPRVGLTVARVPGQAVQETGPDEAVLFGKVYEVTADGTRTLLGGAVAPMRVPVPADGSAARISVTLPGVVAPIEAGNRLMVSIGTTDQGYTGTTTPAAWRIGVDGPGGALVVPVVPGEAVTANTVPLGPLLGIAGVLAAALLATVAARLRRRADTGRRHPVRRGGGAHRLPGPGRRRPRRHQLRGRSRSATSRRPTGAGSAPCTTCRSTSSGAWCWACSVPTAPGRPLSCACSWA